MKQILISCAIGALLVAGVWLLQHEQSAPSTLTSESNEQDLTKLPEGVLEEVRPTEIIVLTDGDEFDLEATTVKQTVGNRTIKRLAYNGQIPGPVLKVEKGAKVTVNFTNNIDMETALHSHGLRGDYLMDGAVPITPAVEVGESFSYELEFPDTGVFWYHPHVREDYQQELGLYGNFIVEEEGYWNAVDQEEYMIVDDFLSDGEFSREHVTHTLMGRYGDTLLINDKTDYNLTVNQGEITRVFITNVANTRTFELSFAGAEMKQVGGDLGRVEHETMIEHQIIAPAERSVLELYYDTPGTYPIEHRGATIGTVTVLPTDQNRSADFAMLRSNTGDYADLRSNITSLLAKTPDKNLRLDIAMKGMGGQRMRELMESDGEVVNLMGMRMTHEQAVEHCEMMPEMAGCEPFLSPSEEDAEETVEHGSEDGIEWEDDMAVMNTMSSDSMMSWIIEDTDTGAINGDIGWTFATGDLVKVRVYNDPSGMHPMQHPLHFHGQRFVVLATDDELNENMQWKDTILIPKGQTVDLLVDMSNPGQWMAHCHIAEHLHSGMMFQFAVE